MNEDDGITTGVMTKEQDARRLLMWRLLGGAALSAPLIAAATGEAEAANILFENTLFLSGAPGATTKRTPAARCSDIINVLDYGADPTGAADSAPAIQAALNAAYTLPNKSDIVYFPPGTYKALSTIDIGNHNAGGNGTSGIIRGSGRWATSIFGNIGNGFIFSQADGVNGPEEISNLSITNISTVIGTGALFINNSSALVSNCNFTGMINVLMPFNIYQATFLNCTGGSLSNVTTGHAGTFGIAGYHANIIGWRSTSPYQCCLQLYGSNTAAVNGCGIENCTVAWIAGMATGWASQCTVSGTTLTVGGNLGTTAFQQFGAGTEIFMQGLTTTADWGISPVDASRCTIVSQLSGNPGLDGTYQISRSAIISSPVPCVSRYTSVLSGTTIGPVTTEACYYIGVIMSVAACTFQNCGGGSAFGECPDAFGTAGVGIVAQAGIYMFGSGGATFINCTPNNNPALASWYFDPAGGVGQYCFINCNGQKQADFVTGTSSSISNGSGSSGTILNVISGSGWGVGIGMRVFVGGVSKGKVIGNHVTDATLTGTGGLGTYRLDTSNLVTGSVITINVGDDWILPTGDSLKTALQFINCNSANLPVGYTSGLANGVKRTYASLPGNSGSNNNFPVQDGMLYDIVDGHISQCADGSCATFGTHVSGGGGALHLQVRYNAAKGQWILTGI